MQSNHVSFSQIAVEIADVYEYEPKRTRKHVSFWLVSRFRTGPPKRLPFFSIARNWAGACTSLRREYSGIDGGQHRDAGGPHRRRACPLRAALIHAVRLSPPSLDAAGDKRIQQLCFGGG